MGLLEAAALAQERGQTLRVTGDLGLRDLLGDRVVAGRALREGRHQSVFERGHGELRVSGFLIRSAPPARARAAGAASAPTARGSALRRLLGELALEAVHPTGGVHELVARVEGWQTLQISTLSSEQQPSW